MQHHREKTYPQNQTYQDLQGPFSPFAIALRNIKQNLISKYRTISERNIQEEILKEVITLNIVLGGTLNSSGPRYMEFPVAASWRLKATGERYGYGRYFYSGEFPSEERAGIPKEIRRAGANVRKKVRELVTRPASAGPFDSFEGENTEYPESLRDIKGYWRITVKGFVFLVLYTYFPKQAEISNEDISVARDVFETFLSDGLVNFLTLVKRGRYTTFLNATAARRTGLASDVPILEDIVSRIQDEITKVKSNVLEVSSVRSRVAFEEAFSVVFVRPALNDDEKLCFRYILTDKQRDYLKRVSQSDIKQLVEKKENEVLKRFSSDFKTLVPQFGPIRTLSDLKRAIARCEALRRDKPNIEEFVRRAVFSYYAFHPKCRDAFNRALSRSANNGKTANANSSGLADTIEMSSNWVTAKQAFIITRILQSKSSDVVSDFINHPFAKYLQHSTDELLDLFHSDFLLVDGQPFYPEVLHVFEMLFFPKRFFMYPVYQFEDAVLLLCAFNADYYLQSRTSLKAIIDRYAPAILNTILASQQSDTTRLFEDPSVRDRSKGQLLLISDIEKVYISILERRLKHLLRLFCRDMVYVEQLHPLREISAVEKRFASPTDRAVINENGVLIRLDLANEVKTYEIRIKPRVAPGNRFIIASRTAQHLLKLYLEAYADIFCRTIKNIDLVKKITRASLSSVVAHAVKTSLSPLAALSNVLVDSAEQVQTLVSNINHYKSSSGNTPISRAFLETEKVDAAQLNSITNVLSFYAEDAETKVDLLYGGLKKDQDRTELTEPCRIEQFIVAGLVRGYCIALIKVVDNIVRQREAFDFIKIVQKMAIEVNGTSYSLRVPAIEQALEASRPYKFDKQPGVEVDIADLRLDAVRRATFGIITGNHTKLPEWKCRLLLIVVEELMLNALRSKGLTGAIVVTTNAQCLFGIQNISESKIPDKSDLEHAISTGKMGGLHTAFFLVEDPSYLGMTFDRPEPLESGPKERPLYTNVVRIVEADNG